MAKAYFHERLAFLSLSLAILRACEGREWHRKTTSIDQDFCMRRPARPCQARGRPQQEGKGGGGGGGGGGGSESGETSRND